MRADRLVSLVLLLRQRGRLTANTLAREPEVSTRTVLRDIEALAAEELPEAAQRPDRVDLDRIWRERSARFLSDGDHIIVLTRVDPARREELLNTALAVRAEEPDADGQLRLEVTFQDARHAEWALWQLGTDAEVLFPQSLRTRLRDRAAAMATNCTDPS